MPSPSARKSLPTNDDLIAILAPRLHQISAYLIAKERHHEWSAGDLLNETYLRRLRYMAKSFENPEHFLHTAHGLLKLALMDDVRRRKSAKRTPAALPAPESERLDDATALRLAVNALPADERAIIWSRYYLGHCWRETEKVLAVPVWRARELHASALLALREALSAPGASVAA